MKTSYIKGRLLFTAMLMTLIGVFTSCEEDYKLELPLALTQEELTLGASGGSTHVLVYSTGNWTATFKDPADASWASIEQGSGKENGEFIFNYSKNPGVGRQAIIVITTGSETKELAMNQSGYVTAPNVTLLNQNFRMPAWESVSSVPFSTNLELALEQVKAIIDYGDFDTTEGADNSAVEKVRATPENPGWLTGIVIEADTIRFKVAANADGLPRVARLIIRATNEATGRNYDTQAFVTQTAENGYIRFNAPDQPAEVEAFEKTVSFLWDTNMETYFNKMKFEVSYTEAGEEWIRNLTPTKTGLQADIAESTYAGERHARITATYNGPEGTVTAIRDVVQDEPVVEMPFSDLRALLTSAGSVTLDKGFIMAQVVSDPANPNADTNPHTTWNLVDFSEANTTAYIQSLDGTYGLRVKLAAGTDPQLLPRYATVKIALSGLTIEREDNPARYTIRGLNAGAILETTPGTESSLPAKEKYINELTDNDIYTLVTFKDIELAFPFGGGWGQIHEGFASKDPSGFNPTGHATNTRCDAMPRAFRDNKGGTIQMIINARVPWRREGKAVPKGSGTVKGIIVHSPLKRYNANGDMGRYQFRVMERADINLAATTQTQTIAQWGDFIAGSSAIKKVEGSSTKVLPSIGSGYMDTDVPGATTATTTSFIGNVFPQLSSGQTVNNSASGYWAFRYDGKWWDFDNNTGRYISWTFSTAGHSGSHFVMAFDCGTGNQGAPVLVPIHWDLEYSTDGTNFTKLASKFVLYPAPVFAYDKMDAPAGNAEYVFDLPDSLLGQESVTIRLKAADKKYNTTAGLASGTLTASNIKDQYIRFDAITFKYNK